MVLASTIRLPSASHRFTCTGLYMNRSRCQEDTGPLGVPIQSICGRWQMFQPVNGGRCQLECPVLRRRGGAWTDVGVQVRDAE